MARVDTMYQKKENVVRIGSNTVYNADCMVYMVKMKDNEFDLAICDPPYGGGQHFNFRFGTGDKVYPNDKPLNEYFDELRRVSKNQIIWGGNYICDMVPVNRCWLCWQKGQPIDAFSDFELAWTSFDKTSKTIKLDSYGFNHADKRHNGESTIHPTQKPVSLYRWLLNKYAKKGDKILDTHLGSGSIAIACHYMGYELTAFEIDEEYFNASVKRIKEQTAQKSLYAT